tara:strand:+ start:3316 stop:6318 length:3003 start_codon:yes stop_codon:yes gene_type:complete
MSNGLKNSILSSDTAATKFLEGLKRQTLDIIYGKGKTSQDFVNFNDNAQRQQFVAGIKNIRQNPGIVPITNTIEVFNTYDICSPLQFIATQAFPPGSAVAEAISGFEGKANDLLNVFKKFQFIEGNQLTEGVYGYPNVLEEGNPLVPFDIGKITLVVPNDQPGGEIQAPIHKSSQVILRQVDDPSIGSKMIGTVDKSFPVTGEDVGMFTDAVVGVGYIMNITSISPPTPPYAKDKNGNTLKDEEGEPLVRGFENFTMEFEADPATTDVRELATELDGLTTALRELGIEGIKTDLAAIPPTVPGISKLKEPFEKFISIIEGVEGDVSNVATEAGTVQTTLEGGLNAQQVIERVRILKDIQDKILPFTNVTSFIEEKFKKQIEDVNRFLVDAIPYDQLSSFVTIIVNFTKFVNGVISFILALLRTINMMLKIITIVIKVFKVVLKVVKAVIKALPAAFVPVGAIQLVTEKLAYIDAALDTALVFVKRLSKNIEGVIRSLSIVQKFVTKLTIELAKFARKLDECNNLPGKDKFTGLLENALRNSFVALNNLRNSVPQAGGLNGTANDVTNAINATDGDATVIARPDGTLLVLPGSVYGFDAEGNILFIGELVSLATGVSFEDSRGEALRDKLTYYTFNKFDAANRGLLEAADQAYLDTLKEVDPEDVFGNFVEIYLGYTLKVQEEKPINASDSTLTRRRGVALDSNEFIVAGTELTFSTDLGTIIQELKFKLKRDVESGVLGVNTTDKDPNEIDDDTSIEMVRTTGGNALAISNLKAEQANRAAALPELKDNPDQTPTEARVGNTAFRSIDDSKPAQSTPNPSVKNKPLDTQTIVKNDLNEFISSNPSLSKIANNFNILSGASSSQLNQVLSQPGVEELSEDELIANLKESILSNMDPNPDKIEEIKNKTEQWYEGLKSKAQADYDRLVSRTPMARKILPPFEEYFNKIEEQELPKWIKLLLRQRYTETEVNYGIQLDDIREEYRIKINGTKVKVKRKRGRKK